MADVSQINLPNNSNYFVRDRVTHVELTQAQYDALVQAGQVDPDKVYFITDAPSMSGTSADLSYDGTSKSVYTKIGEMDTAISGKADSSSLATVATSGSYNDLSDKPTIPAAQVKSDWNSSSGVSEILNKPTLATVATSGSYNDLSNKPTIPSVSVFSYYGVILNAAGGTLRGFGSAMVTMCGGIARIDFNLLISVDETTSGVTAFGINRDYFTALTGKEITPQAGGVVTYYNNEQVYANRMDFGGTFMINGQFWRPARVYDDNGTKKIGGWGSQTFASGQRFIGTCYGTYT